MSQAVAHKPETFSSCLQEPDSERETERMRTRLHLEIHFHLGESLLTCLADLFNSIATQKKKVGVIPPKKFISRLRKENGRSTMNTSGTLISFDVSSKDEDFLDLSVDVEQNTSITHCLRGFSNTETLCSEYKYYCEQCRSKQEAQKRQSELWCEQVSARQSCGSSGVSAEQCGSG
ncbi:hypothetical protein INR49_004079 [Caranx melampygus]|nr:hypothetical protein INR49_004079 [Caranx melampygus]